MRVIRISFLLITIAIFNSCASGYKLIQPEFINYVSSIKTNNVELEYKYDLLDKKYAKKEVKKGVKLVAVKITNNTDRNIKFGRDAVLTYPNGREVYVLENEQVFKTLKQSPASYLWYLLLSPLNFYTAENGEETSSTPVGLILGPGLAGGNLIAASSANSKFKKELSDYNLYDTIIAKGETKYGLVGIKSDSYEALKIQIK